VSLTAADVAEIMRLVEESVFDELTLEMDGIKLSLRRGGAPENSNRAATAESAASGLAPAASSGGAARASAHAASPGAAVLAPAHRPAAADPAPSPAAAADPNIQEVTAPLLGTFYRSPKPGAPPFVEIGAPVEEDTVVAIIEVMKLMNTVRAGVRGTVAEILPADGSLVEYGATLLRVRKPGE
jgi:acetyl-CoA carboxylase biotin carboxyl carrier protein